MSKIPDDDQVDALLHQGLRSVPYREPGADFNAGVHARLRRPAPWWRPLWVGSRSLLVPAACSLALTLLLLNSIGAPPKSTVPVSNGGANVATEPNIERLRWVEQVLGGTDTFTPSIGGANRPRQSEGEVPRVHPRQPGRHGEGRGVGERPASIRGAA